MASILDKQIKDLLGFFIMEDKASSPATTTVNANVTAGASSFVLAAASTFAIGQQVRLGTGERQEMITVSNLVGTTVTPSKPLEFKHDAGEEVVQQECTAIAAPETAGIRFGFNGETTDVYSALQRLPYGKQDGYNDFTLAWEFINLTADSMGFALGVPRANIIGDGTAAAQTGTVGPRGFTADGNTFGSRNRVNARLTFRYNDGTYGAMDFFNITFDPSQVTAKFSRGNLSTVPVRTMASSARWDLSNSAWTPNTTNSTFAASALDLVQEIVSYSEMTDSGTSTTTTGTVAANAYVLPLTATTGLTGVGIWVRLDSGDNAEYHWSNGVTSLNMNLRTQVQRAHASGVAVVLQTLTEHEGIAEDGFDFAMSGSSKVKRAQKFRNSLGYQTETCTATLSAKLNTFNPADIQQSFNVASSKVANNIVPLRSDSIGSKGPVNLLFVGMTQSQKFVYITGWRGAATLSGETNFGAAQDSLLQLSHKPSVIQFFVAP